jgi:hypothetical protein
VKKQKSLRRLKELVWVEFSKYIRYRETDFQGNANCVTCKRKYHWKLLQAGHFVPGRRNSILYDERNCHAQCYGCNVGKHGDLLNYIDFMKERYGEEVIKELREKNRIDKQFTPDELQLLLLHYKQLNRNIK